MTNIIAKFMFLLHLINSHPFLLFYQPNLHILFTSKSQVQKFKIVQFMSFSVRMQQTNFEKTIIHCWVKENADELERKQQSWTI